MHRQIRQLLQVNTEKKAVAEKKQETTQAPTTESVTTEKQVVTEEEKNARNVQGNVAQATPSQERRREESENGPLTREATPTEVPTVTSSSETVATPPQRLKPLGNTGQEFATLDQATAWMKEQLDQSAKDQEAGNKIGFTLEELMKFHGVTGLRPQPLI